MFFLVIENFKNRDPKPIRERFLSDGRMMPVDLVYHSSWIDPVNARCFQIMETGDPEFLRQWMSHWEDIVDFEIIPVMPSNEYWPLVDKKHKGKAKAKSKK